MRERFGLTCAIAALLLMAGCSGFRGYREAQVAEAAQDWDTAVLKYLDLVHRDPSDLRFRAALLRAKMNASHAHFEQAKRYREAGLLRQGLVELQQAVQLDRTNQYAGAELMKLREQIAAEEAGAEGRETLAETKKKAQGSRAQPPVLNPRSPEPISLDFPEEVDIKKIYQALGKAFGINVLFDPNLRAQNVSIQLNDVTAQDSLEILMRTASHFYKVLDEHSIIVVADTPQNRRIYEDLIIQTFFLSNSDVKEVMTMLRSLVDSRKIAANEQLNAIILRDTADKVKVAERIIRANDKAKAEVVVDIELLQINTSKLQDLGVSLDAYQVGVRLDTGGEEVPLRFSDLEFLNSNNWLLTIPNFMFDFVKNSTEAQTLAKPQLRISEGEQARLTIADRVPIPVTSFNTSNTIGSNVVPLTSFQYQDVGIRIEIEPRVHHNEEVSLKIMVEVSNLAGNIGDQPIIGTRMIETTIRLKDGETNFLAGLIRSDEINSEDSIPGFGDIPLLGRLFSKKRSENQRTDIVLTMTPHIIRRASITPEDLMPIWVGTEANITFRGGSPRIESANEGPFEADEQRDASAADEVRRRLQRLPRGLRPEGGQTEAGADEEAPPSGVDLARPGAARNPLDRRPPPDQSGLELPEVFEREQGPDLPGTGVAPQRKGREGGRLSSPLGPSWARALLPALVLAWDGATGPIDRQGAQIQAQRSPGASPAVGSLGDPEGPGPGPGGPGPGEDPPGGDPGPDPPGGMITLDIEPTNFRVFRGEQISVFLRISSEAAVSHLPARIDFDSSRLEWLSATNAGWLGASGQVGVMGGESKAGSLVVGASRLGSNGGRTGEGRVVELIFRAIAAGTATIEIEGAEALTPELAPLPVDAMPTQVSVRIRKRIRQIEPGTPQPPPLGAQ